MANLHVMKVKKSIVGSIDTDDQSDEDIYHGAFDQGRLRNGPMNLSTRSRNAEMKSHYEGGYLALPKNSPTSNYPSFATPQPARKNQLADPYLSRTHSRNLLDTQNPISHIRSRSFDIIPTTVLVQQLTNDCGTGESVISPIDPPQKIFTDYQVVHVFGQKTKALMRNRYHFDPTVVDEYVKHKYKKTPTMNNKQDTNSNFRETLRNLFIGHKKPKSPRPSPLLSHPLVRHHTLNERPSST